MSMTAAMKTLMCEAFTDHIDKMTFHTGNPGLTGVNLSGVPSQPVVWGAESGGINSAVVVFPNFTGTYPWIGLWEGTTFRMGLPINIDYTATVSVAVLLYHNAIGNEELL